MKKKEVSIQGIKVISETGVTQPYRAIRPTLSVHGVICSQAKTKMTLFLWTTNLQSISNAELPYTMRVAVRRLDLTSPLTDLVFQREQHHQRAREKW